MRDLVDASSELEYPGVSIHPGRALPNREKLTWLDQPRGPYRVIEYTCACEAVYYELISRGGIYMIHRVIQSDLPQHNYIGAWRLPDARVRWRDLLSGHAR